MSGGTNVLQPMRVDEEEQHVLDGKDEGEGSP